MQHQKLLLTCFSLHSLQAAAIAPSLLLLLLDCLESRKILHPLLAIFSSQEKNYFSECMACKQYFQTALKHYYTFQSCRTLLCCLCKLDKLDPAQQQLHHFRTIIAAFLCQALRRQRQKFLPRL